MKTLKWSSIVSILFLSTLAPPLHAGMWDDLIRGAVKAADDVPGSIRGADDIADRLSSHPRSRQVAMEEVGDLKKISDPREVSRLVDGYLVTPSPVLREQISHLAPDKLPQVVVIGKGSKQLAETAGDAATTGRLLREGGADLAGAVGLHGEDVAKDALRLKDLSGGRDFRLSDNKHGTSEVRLRVEGIPPRPDLPPYHPPQ